MREVSGFLVCRAVAGVKLTGLLVSSVVVDLWMFEVMAYECGG